MRSLWLWWSIAVIGCSAPSKPPMQPAPESSRRELSVAPQTSPPSAATPVIAKIEKRVVVSRGRVSGKYVLETKRDGSVVAMLDILQNGRGPHVDATMRFGADGTLTEFRATGHHEMGTKLVEEFTRDRKRVRWKSLEEQANRTIDGTAFFIPISPLFMQGYFVPAALKAGGKLPLLPDGELRVERVGELTVTAGNESRKIIAYAINGIALGRTFAWMNEDGSWFGRFSSFTSVVPEGWESIVDQVIAQQDIFEREADELLYTMNVSKPPAAGLVYTNARVLDVVRGKWLDKHAVVVVGDTIKAVGPVGKIVVPKGAQVIDLAGKALLPGLIDMHSHTDRTDAVLDIASGVTTVRDVGSVPDQIDAYKAWFDAGTAVGPRIVRFGFIEGRNEKAAASKVTAETPEEAIAGVEFFAKRGYEGIKIYNSIRPELVPIITKAAHAKGMLVTGHIPVHMLAHEAVKAGFDGIEHINMIALNFLATKETDTRTPLRFTLVGDKAAMLDLTTKPVQDFFKLLRDKKTVVTPTVAIFQDLLVGEPGKVVPTQQAMVARFPVQTQRSFLINGLPMEGDKRALYRDSYAKLLALVKALYEAKVHLVIGTDHIGGLFLHHEMAMFAKAGVPNAAILKMATLDAARAMKLDKKLGSIAVGKAADMFVVDGDPLAHIDQLEKVVHTMSRGAIFGSLQLYTSVGVSPPGAAEH